MTMTTIDEGAGSFATGPQGEPIGRGATHENSSGSGGLVPATPGIHRGHEAGFRILTIGSIIHRCLQRGSAARRCRTTYPSTRESSMHGRLSLDVVFMVAGRLPDHVLRFNTKKLHHPTN